MSAHHGEWEDIRENVLNYDEEGGGEQDQVNVVCLQVLISMEMQFTCYHRILLKTSTRRVAPADINI